MRRVIISLATAGLFLLSLNGAFAQREVEPPAIPPMLEGQRPLAQPETKEAVPPKPAEEVKAKGKAKGRTAEPAAKGTKHAKGKHQQKKPAKVASKKVQKNHKKKRPASATKQSGPGEG
jgi:hypothetical protein